LYKPRSRTNKIKKGTHILGSKSAKKQNKFKMLKSYWFQNKSEIVPVLLVVVVLILLPVLELEPLQV
jgi:hypothetical protein